MDLENNQKNYKKFIPCHAPFRHATDTKQSQNERARQLSFSVVFFLCLAFSEIKTMEVLPVKSPEDSKIVIKTLVEVSVRIRDLVGQGARR